MYKYVYVLNSVVKISMMFAKYFEYYTILLRGCFFVHTLYMYHYKHSRRHPGRKFRSVGIYLPLYHPAQNIAQTRSPSLLPPVETHSLGQR